MSRFGRGDVVFWVGDDGALRAEHVPHVFVPRYLSDIDAGLKRAPAASIPTVMEPGPSSHRDEEFHEGLGEVSAEVFGRAPHLRAAQEQRAASGVERQAKLAASMFAAANRQRSKAAVAAASLGIVLVNGRLPRGTRPMVLQYLALQKARTL